MFIRINLLQVSAATLPVLVRYKFFAIYPFQHPGFAGDKQDIAIQIAADNLNSFRMHFVLVFIELMRFSMDFFIEELHSTYFDTFFLFIVDRNIVANFVIEIDILNLSEDSSKCLIFFFYIYYSQANASTIYGDISSLAAPRILSVATRETSECSERQTSGLICKSCELLATCIRVHGNWQMFPVESCNNDEGVYCNLRARGCSNATGPCNPLGFEGNFACTSEGVFPDPYDCQKYHMCYRVGDANVSVKIECGNDRAYAAATGDCALSIKDTVCTQPQYKCQNSGETNAWPGNANIFYICQATYDHGQRILFPTLYRCAAREVFNGTDCVPRIKLIGDGHNDDGNSNQHEHFRCQKSGLFADSNDCKSYYHCDYSLRWKRHTCEQSSHFDSRIKACMRGNC